MINKRKKGRIPKHYELNPSLSHHPSSIVINLLALSSAFSSSRRRPVSASNLQLVISTHPIPVYSPFSQRQNSYDVTSYNAVPCRMLLHHRHKVRRIGRYTAVAPQVSPSPPQLRLHHLPFSNYAPGHATIDSVRLSGFAHRSVP